MAAAAAAASCKLHAEAAAQVRQDKGLVQQQSQPGERGLAMELQQDRIAAAAKAAARCILTSEVAAQVRWMSYSSGIDIEASSI